MHAISSLRLGNSLSATAVAGIGVMCSIMVLNSVVLLDEDEVAIVLTNQAVYAGPVVL